MRPTLITFLIAVAVAGCGHQQTEEESRENVFQREAAPGSPSSAADVEQLETWSGQKISVVGTFEHLNFKTGILKLDSGLKIYMPHFDLFMEGDDWLKYVGQRCWAKGILHTYTKNIEGYRGPSLELFDFSGP